MRPTIEAISRSCRTKYAVKNMNLQCKNMNLLKSLSGQWIESNVCRPRRTAAMICWDRRPIRKALSGRCDRRGSG